MTALFFAGLLASAVAGDAADGRVELRFRDGSTATVSLSPSANLRFEPIFGPVPGAEELDVPAGRIASLSPSRKLGQLDVTLQDGRVLSGSPEGPIAGKEKLLWDNVAEAKFQWDQPAEPVATPAAELRIEFPGREPVLLAGAFVEETWIEPYGNHMYRLAYAGASDLPITIDRGTQPFVVWRIPVAAITQISVSAAALGVRFGDGAEVVGRIGSGIRDSGDARLRADDAIGRWTISFKRLARALERLPEKGTATIRFLRRPSWPTALAPAIGTAWTWDGEWLRVIDSQLTNVEMDQIGADPASVDIGPVCAVRIEDDPWVRYDNGAVGWLWLTGRARTAEGHRVAGRVRDHFGYVAAAATFGALRQFPTASLRVISFSSSVPSRDDPSE